MIDFDDSGFGWFMAEIANAVFFQAGTPAFAPALRAMVRGYQQVSHIPNTDLRMLDVMLFLRGAAVLGWIETRSETETAGQIAASVKQITLALAHHLLGDSEQPLGFRSDFELLRFPDR